MNPTVKEIVLKYLQENGYDGLFTEDCGCELSDLMPCSYDCLEYCEAGYKQPCDCGEGCDWHIGREKP